MNERSIRVLIVDDSAVARGLIAKSLSDDDEIEVVGTAMDGLRALEWLSQNHTDVALLDIEMPAIDGLETLKRLKAEHPKVQAIMVSSHTQSGAKATVRALSLGASGSVAKPLATGTVEGIRSISRELIPLLKSICQPANPSLNLPLRESPGDARSSGNPRRVQLPPKAIVIGASTGGPNALQTILTALPRDFSIPILIVQHMPPMFTSILARDFARDTGRPCCEASDGLRIENNHTYIAPGDYHMTVRITNNDQRLQLDQNPREHYCRPSVNPLFRSAAAGFGDRLLAIMLTGMGYDGIEGVRDVVHRGGVIIAQDEASSVVWGMPGIVVSEGLANYILPLEMIVDQILECCQLPSRHLMNR